MSDRHRLAVLRCLYAVVPRAQTDFLRTGAGDDDAAITLDGHLDAGIIDSDDERALGRENADHRGSELGDARRLGQSQRTDEEQQHRGGNRPAAPAWANASHTPVPLSRAEREKRDYRGMLQMSQVLAQ